MISEIGSGLGQLATQGSGDVQMMQLKQYENGAACGVAVEALSCSAMTRHGLRVYGGTINHRGAHRSTP